MILIVQPKLIHKNFRAVTLWPFIVLKFPEDKEDEVLINHEKIHLQQQVELAVVFFYIWYLVEFLLGLSKYGKFLKAYYTISFEKEAYANESDMNYLRNRKRFAFLNYYK